MYKCDTRRLFPHSLCKCHEHASIKAYVTNALIVYISVIAFITILISRWKKYVEFLEGKSNGNETRL